MGEAIVGLAGLTVLLFFITAVIAYILYGNQQ